MKINITAQSKKLKLISAESSNFQAILHPSYSGSSPSKLLFNENDYTITVTNDGAVLSDNEKILCKVKELQRTISGSTLHRIPRKIEFTWDDYTIQLRQKIESYKIFDKNHLKIGTIRKKMITRKNIEGTLTISKDIPPIILAFISTLVGHLWQSDLSVSNIKRDGGLSILAEEREPSKSEANIFGVICVAVSIYCYFYLSSMEKSSSPEKIWWLLAFVYNLGGKFLVCGLLIFLGFLSFLLGKSLESNKENKTA